MNQSASKIRLPLSDVIRAYLELMRPANIVTAFADILTGIAAAVGVMTAVPAIENIPLTETIWLLLSTLGLYGGGVVFNDVFDAELDAEERPERAIPSGRVSKAEAMIFGGGLLVLGIFAAFLVNSIAGSIAIVIAAMALVYDYSAKHSVFWGPLLMGLCRGGNLLLGCSILSAVLPQIWYLALIPVFYIASITLISQGEVHGGSKASGYTALGLVISVSASLLLLAFHPSYDVLAVLPFAALFAFLVIPPFYKAAESPDAAFIQKAVKRGVISLIVMNSAIAAGFAGFLPGLIVLALLPFSFLLARLFAVT